MENDRVKSEAVTSSTSSTISPEITTSRNEEISHREHGRSLNLTNVVPKTPAKAKAFNDLSDVSMDDDNFGDGNGAKEEMVIAQTQHKECESKVRKFEKRKEKKNEFREVIGYVGAQWRCTPKLPKLI